MTNSVDVSVGDRVRLLRLSRKESRSDLGKALDVDEMSVMRLERGTKRIGAGLLRRIAVHYQVPTKYFFEAIPKPTVQGLTAIEEVRISRSSDDKVSQTTELLKAFVALDDPDHRARVIALCHDLSENGDAPD